MNADKSTRTIVLPCGTLHLQVEEAELALEDLCGYACRRSRKRGFVFVSKVLGKHYPVRPAVMEDTHTRLASRLGDLPGPVLMIALAETATGLGQGVYEQWLRRTGRQDALFMHTTRYRLRRPLALCFEEPHSHATEHLLYEPDDIELFAGARTLVLIDDELSTGNTLANLGAAYRQRHPGLAAVHIVCLTDWLGPERRVMLARRLGVPVAVHSLLRGTFRLEENAAFDPGPIPDVIGKGDFKDGYLPPHSARQGVRGLLAPDYEKLLGQPGIRPGERLLVLGTGEFSYPPYLLARYLERRGWDVHYQSTTRSPLLVGGDICSMVEFVDNYHDDMPNYVYNVVDRWYDRILAGYETRPLPPAHRLVEQLGCQVARIEELFFGSSDAYTLQRRVLGN